MTPCFSIVIPAYNAELTLAETLAAVAAQTFGDWECIIVDDGSSDGTLALAAEYATRDSRFRVISQENQGTGGAYNAGVRASAGDNIVICSADDVLLPEHLATVSAFIESHRDYDIFSTNGLVRMESGATAPRYSTRQAECSLQLADVIAECFYGVGAVYRRSVFNLVGGYQTGIFGEDYDFWLRAMASGARHRYIPQILSQHRISSGQKSAQRERWWRSDIQIVSDLIASSDLCEGDLAATRRLIRDRERRIARLPSPLARTLGSIPCARRLLRSAELAYRRKLGRS
ncbi:MAG: glycosyltransferase family 2 protein [Coriobacteriia bacterium]|nr:glycosyltransferase family 2 protein [Coriobacteriia bacterium]